MRTVIERFRNNPILLLTAIAAAGLAVYANSFSVPFQFDDIPNITDNPFIADFRYFIDTDLSRAYVMHAAMMSRYIGYLSFTVNYAIGGLDVWGYHLVNVIIHILNAVLVFLFVNGLFNTPFLKEVEESRKAPVIPFMTALLFVLHPLQTQAVTYIVQRLTSLAAFFFLLSVVLYLFFRTAETKRWQRVLAYWTALMSAVLAMKTKEIAFTLPCILVMLELMFLDGRMKDRLFYLAPFIATMLIIPVSLLSLAPPGGDLLQRAQAASKLGTQMSRAAYFFTQLPVVAAYIGLLFVPAGQNIDHDFPVYRNFFDMPVILSALFLLGLMTAGAWLYLRAKRGKSSQLMLAAAGIFWFFICLSVESSVFPIADVMFEHRTYLPSVGFFLAAVIAVRHVYERFISLMPRFRRIAVIAVVLICMALGTLTVMRNVVWGDAVTLWADTVEKSPRKARPNFGLASAYRNKGDIEAAIVYYEKAISADPAHTESLTALGNIYYIRGQLDKARKYYEKAVLVDYNNADAIFNLARVMDRTGDTVNAQRLYRELLAALSADFSYLAPDIKKRIDEIERRK